VRDGTLYGVLGLRITEPTGARTLRVDYRNDRDEPRTLLQTVTVRPTPFPVRRLTMKRSVERLYNFPGAKVEDAAVNRALSTASEAWLWSGVFRLPAQGRMATPFGVKRIRNRRTVYYHRGMDIAAPTGRPVMAPNGGRVVLSRAFKKYGGTVVLDHGGGVTTLYLHMSARAVREGETVAAGRRIGSVGATGVATGPHLHWGLYVHGVAVNPAFWTQLPLEVIAGVTPGSVNRHPTVPAISAPMRSHPRAGFGAGRR
jgi:murein DD-endopeptidase MepM/ murein hydrolase activator NlpD